MTAAVWTLIALLAVSQGVLATALFQLRGEFRTEFGDLRREMREGFAAQGARIDAQGVRIEAQGARIEYLAGKIDAHIDRHAG